MTLFVGRLALDYLSTFSSSGDLLFDCSLVLATQGVEQMRNSAALEFGEHFVVVDNFFGSAVALDGDQGAERFDGLGWAIIDEWAQGSEAAASRNKDQWRLLVDWHVETDLAYSLNLDVFEDSLVVGALKHVRFVVCKPL